MSNFFTIMDPSIGLVYKEENKKNGVAGISFYFTRKTVDSNLPIEISFVDYDGEINAVSRQLNGSFLDSASIDGVDKFMYMNDIIFDKNEIANALSTIPNEEVDNDIVSIIDGLFGIDISGVDNIEALEFDKVVYVDRLDVDGTSNYLDGYMLIFHDISTKTVKLALYAGELVAYTYEDYKDQLNEYGKSRILSEILVTNSTSKTIIKNTSPFRVKIKMDRYTYDVNRAVYRDKSFTINYDDGFTFVLTPGQEYSFVHDNAQRERSYSLLDNPIDPPRGPIYSMNSWEYNDASEYIVEAPFKLSFQEVISPVGVTDPDRYLAVSSMHNLFKDKYSFERAIVDKNDDLLGLEVISSHGTIKVSNDSVFKDFASSGGASVFADKIRVMLKSKLKKIYSYLGQDEMNILVDYSIESTRYRILDIQNRIVYNDTISMPQQAFTVTIGLIGNIDEVLQKSSHLEYEMIVKKGDLPCKSDRKALINKIIGAELFTSDYLSFNVNDVLNNPTKKVYQGPSYKTYNGEIDDAYEMYQKRMVSEIEGFGLVNSSDILSSKEFAAVMPVFNMLSEGSDGCTEDFVFDIEESIDEHGLEISLNDMLKKMRQVAYIYRQKEEIIATVSLGITLDNEWYFCGEDFFPASVIENSEYTTYMDNDVVTMSRDIEGGNVPIYDKKLFLDSNDWDEDYKQQMHDAFMAFVVGSIDTSTIYDNPGLKYIVDHLLDRQRKLSFSYDDIFIHARDIVFSKKVEHVRNTMIMPNIFEQMIADGKTNFTGYVGDDDAHYFGKLKAEYHENYYYISHDEPLDSAYEIGHTVSAMMNTDSIKNGSLLYREPGKLLFGVNTGSFTQVDTLSVKKETNVIMDGERYAFALSLVKNDVKEMSICYDYKTKNLKIVNLGSFTIHSFPLLMASFDVLLHDYYSSLEGYKRVALGVYDYYESDIDSGTLSKQYLLVNNTLQAEDKYILLKATVGLYDAQVMVDADSAQWKYMYMSGLNNGIRVRFTGGDLQIQKGDRGTSTIPRTLMENYPDTTLAIDGAYIKLYRLERFLPVRYNNESITRTIIKVTDADGALSSLIGSLTIVDFGSYKEVLSPNGKKYAFALGGEGIVGWSSSNGYTMPPEKLLDIDEILYNKDAIHTITIDDIVFQITFE